MMRALIGVIVALLSVASLFAAQAPVPAPVAPAPAPAPAQAGPPASPQGFAYTADGRRDPFISLLRRGTDPQRGGAVRPAGIAGLLVSEITLRGTVASRGGYVAILQGSDGRTYIVREGEKLFDGAVRSITEDTLVLLQQVNDPLSLETQREVRKVLRQTEEAQ
jgi:Tfp pilus assembly protein PilP